MDSFNQPYVNSSTQLIKDDDKDAQGVAHVVEQIQIRESEEKVMRLAEKAEMEVQMELIKTENFFKTTELPPIPPKKDNKRKLMISDTMEFKMDQVL